MGCLTAELLADFAYRAILGERSRATQRGVGIGLLLFPLIPLCHVARRITEYRFEFLHLP